MFWDYPHPRPKISKFAKKSNFAITLHVTHLLKLLDKMYKYWLDPTSIVEDTEWTRIRPQMDRYMDGCQTDRQTRWNHYNFFNFIKQGVWLKPSILEALELMIFFIIINSFIAWIKRVDCHFTAETSIWWYIISLFATSNPTWTLSSYLILA